MTVLDLTSFIVNLLFFIHDSHCVLGDFKTKLFKSLHVSVPTLVVASI